MNSIVLSVSSLIQFIISCLLIIDFLTNLSSLKECDFTLESRKLFLNVKDGVKSLKNKIMKEVAKVVSTLLRLKLVFFR